MTPYDLLGLVAIILVSRIALSIRPVTAASKGRSVAIAREYLDPFIYAGIAAWLLITFVARTYYIPSASMVPTLEVHDVLLVDKFEYRFHAPHEGDVVVFPPPIPTPDDFIKRVIGLPGERLHITKGIVYINDVALDEPYIAAETELRPKDRELRHLGQRWIRLACARPRRKQTSRRNRSGLRPIRFRRTAIMMFGDNRNDSEDSHIWGFAQDAGTFANRSADGRTRRLYGPRVPDLLAARPDENPEIVAKSTSRGAVRAIALACEPRAATCDPRRADRSIFHPLLASFRSLDVSARELGRVCRHQHARVSPSTHPHAVTSSPSGTTARRRNSTSSA